MACPPQVWAGLAAAAERNVAAPYRRAEERAAHSGTQSRAEQFSASVLRAVVASQARARGPGTRPGQALDKASRVENPLDGHLAEDERGNAHQD